MTSTPTDPSTETGCSAKERPDPPIRTFAPTPTPRATLPLAPTYSPASDARYVVRRVCGAGLAYYRHSGDEFSVVPPGWSGTVPAEFTRIDAPTPDVWIIGRTKTDGPPDYEAVHKIQSGFKVTPFSNWGKQPRPVEVRIDPSVDTKTAPSQVDAMPAGKFFGYAAELLKLHAPHITDEPIVAQMIARVRLLPNL